MSRDEMDHDVSLDFKAYVLYGYAPKQFFEFKFVARSNCFNVAVMYRWASCCRNGGAERRPPLRQRDADIINYYI